MIRYENKWSLGLTKKELLRLDAYRGTPRAQWIDACADSLETSQPVIVHIYRTVAMQLTRRE